MVLYLKDGNMSYYAYAKSDDGAAMLSVETRKFVKKGNIVLVLPLGAYTIVKNEDGTSGTINSPLGKIEYSGLTENSVFFVAYDSEGNEPVRMQLYTLEYLGCGIGRQPQPGKRAGMPRPGRIPGPSAWRTDPYMPSSGKPGIRESAVNHNA